MAFEAALAAAAAANHLFVAAAGNDGRDNDITPQYPCNYDSPNVICVASTTSSNDLSGFSNWGMSSVHIAAPGTRIYSTYPNNQYQALSGTSMACPHVSGVAALVLDYVPNMPYASLRDIILNSAVTYSKFASKVSSGALLNAHAALLMAGQHAWIRMSSPASLTVPSQSSTQISLEFGGSSLDFGEYRARLRIWGMFNNILYSRLVPILYTVHNFASAPSVGPTSLQFQDLDGRRDMISGALTITRATPDQEATFSQYHVFWAGSSQARLSETPLAAMDTGNVLHDDFAAFDPTFWSVPEDTMNQANWSVSNGAAIFSGQFHDAHLTLARRFAPPFTIRTKVRKASGALAHMVVQVGGSDASLFGVGSIRAVFFGSQKVLISPHGQHTSVPCTLGTWFEATIVVSATSVTFSDSQGCADIVKPIASSEATKSIRIGADCPEECATNGGSAWDHFEISGGLYATFNVPDGTMIPAGATGFVAHAWNVLGMNPAGIYQGFTDHRVANRAAQPSNVGASSPTTSSSSISWTRGSLNDCTSFVRRSDSRVFSCWRLRLVVVRMVSWAPKVRD